MVDYGRIISRDGDNKSKSNYPNRWDGCRFVPQKDDLVGVQVQTSSRTFGVREVAIFDKNDNKLVSNYNGSDWGSYDYISVYDTNLSLNKGETYFVLGIQDSGNFRRGALGSPNYTYYSPDINVPAGAYGRGDYASGNFPMWQQVRAIRNPVSAPSTPQNLSSSVSGDDVTLDWDPVSWNGDQGHYDVYRGTTSGSYSQIAQVNSGTTSYTDSNLTAGQTYYYVVDANNSAGTSGDSNEASATIPLPAPTNVRISDDTVEDQLTIDWNPVSDATSYNVYRAQASGSIISHYTLVAQPTSPPYTDTGLEDGERYYYRVTSEN